MEIIATILPVISIIFMVGVYIFSYSNGYFDFAYIKYKKAYNEYHAYVLTKEKNYNRYVRDFINGNQFISSGEKQPNEHELNKRNQSLLSLFELLETGEQLVVKYFTQAKFTYHTEYRELINEWNKYEVQNEGNAISNTPELSGSTESINADEVTPFGNMILLEGEEKNIILEKIKQHLNTLGKGKSVAFMIIALKKHGYLASAVPSSHILDALRTHFSIDIGTDRGVYKFLKEDNLDSQNKTELEHITTYFKVK